MRYLVLLASVIVQACLGGVYAWSEFAKALKADYGFSQAQTQIIFGCLIAAFTVSMVFAGKILHRLGPRWIAAIGGVLFAAGYGLASLSGGEFWLLFPALSLLVGAGTGFGYVCPLATCMKWFPNHRGLVTGIAVGGFGGGAVVLTSSAEALMSGGMDVLTVFAWVGLVYGVAIVASAMALKVPGQIGSGASRHLRPIGALLSDRYFLALIAGMFSGTFAGLLVVGNLKDIATSAGLHSVATLSISVFAIGNAAGRITWGHLADRLGDRSIPITLASLAAALALLGLAGFVPLFLVATFLTAFGFGACFVVYAARVASHYGADHVAAVYPPVFLAYGAAGIAGPWLGGLLFDTTKSYTPAILLSVAVVAAGVLGCVALLRASRPPEGELTPAETLAASQSPTAED